MPFLYLQVEMESCNRDMITCVSALKVTEITINFAIGFELLTWAVGPDFGKIKVPILIENYACKEFP